MNLNNYDQQAGRVHMDYCDRSEKWTLHLCLVFAGLDWFSELKSVCFCEIQRISRVVKESKAHIDGSDRGLLLLSPDKSFIKLDGKELPLTLLGGEEYE